MSGYRMSVPFDWRGAVRESGLSQVEVARRAEVSASYLSDVVNGRRVPPLETAHRIALACGSGLPSIPMDAGLADHD